MNFIHPILFYINGYKKIKQIMLINKNISNAVKSKTKLINCRGKDIHQLKYLYPDFVYIGRPSKWGNPFKPKDSSNDERLRVINLYEEWITNGDGKYLLNDLHELKGKILGCWCKPKPCHGDILIKLLTNLTNLTNH